MDPRQGGSEMIDKRPILLATDGSPSAKDAQDEAFELARRLGAPLLVVSVEHAAYPAAYAGYGYPSALAELKEEERKRVIALLTSVEEAAEAAGLSCSTIAADGFVVEEICRKASDYDAQLIVVGSHGWGAARRLFSGSVSTGLVHSAPCPVLVVRRPAAKNERAEAA
jgi:nucleotide-binding universal stress UspA family protein